MMINVIEIEKSNKAAVIRNPIPFSVSSFSFGSSDSKFAAYLELILVDTRMPLLFFVNIWEIDRLWRLWGIVHVKPDAYY